jgi:hypothetical protein
VCNYSQKIEAWLQNTPKLHHIGESEHETPPIQFLSEPQGYSIGLIPARSDSGPGADLEVQLEDDLNGCDWVNDWVSLREAIGSSRRGSLGCHVG